MKEQIVEQLLQYFATANAFGEPEVLFPAVSDILMREYRSSLFEVRLLDSRSMKLSAVESFSAGIRNGEFRHTHGSALCDFEIDLSRAPLFRTALYSRSVEHIREPDNVELLIREYVESAGAAPEDLDSDGFVVSVAPTIAEFLLIPLRFSSETIGLLVVAHNEEISPSDTMTWRYVAHVVSEILFAARLALERDIYRSAAELTSASVAISDALGAIVDVNPAFLSAWGFSEKRDVIGRQNGELVAEGENERDTRRLMRPVDEAGGSFLARRHDGTEFPVTMRSRLVTGAVGTPPRVVLVEVAPRGDEAEGEPSNADPANAGAGPAQLTSREIDVAEMIKQGLSSKEAADKLGISERAVVFHRQSLRRKLGVTGSSEGLRNALLRLSGIGFDK